MAGAPRASSATGGPATPDSGGARTSCRRRSSRLLSPVPKPVGEPPACLLDLLLGGLRDALEPARVVVDGVAGRGARVDVVAALGIVAADDPVVLPGVHPLRQLVDAA